MDMLRRFGRDTPTVSPGPTGPAIKSGPSNGGGMVQHHTAGGHSAGVKSTARPSDMEQIRSTARQAVAASRPGTGAMEIKTTRQNIASPPESQQAYCDPSAEANIRMACDRGPKNCQVWLPIGASAAVRGRLMGRSEGL